MKKLILIAIIIINLISTIGCRKSEMIVDKLIIPMATGYDITSDGKYKLTVQILKPSNEASSGKGSKKDGGQSQPQDVFVISATGNTWSECFNKISLKLGKKLSAEHTAFIVLGANISKLGFSPALDASLRSSGKKIDSPVFVCKDTAFDIINAKSSIEKIPSNEVRNSFKIQSSLGFIPAVSKLDIANSLLNEHPFAIASVIDLNKDTTTNETFKIGGTAVFNKDKLIGFMDLIETRGMQWIKGNVQSGVITALTPDKGKISFNIVSSKSKIKPTIKDNNITIEINVKANTEIVELESNLDPLSDPEVMDELSRLQNETIKKEIESAVNKVQNEFKIDILDFGGAIHRSYPQKWKNIKKSWDNIFYKTNVKIHVDSKVRRPGLISKPIQPHIK